MWQLSQKTQELLGQLNELGRTKSWLWVGQTRRDETICQLLSELAKAAEPATVSCAAQFLFFSSAVVRSAARTTITSLLSKVPPFDLIHISGALTQSWEWHINGPWDVLLPDAVKDLAADKGEDPNTAVLGLISFHRNGFVRQEAVRLLSMSDDGSELPFLLIRQNDWVAKIAARAQTEIERRIDEQYCRQLVHSLRLILHLATYRRYDHSSLVRKIVQLVIRTSNEDVLRSILTSPDRVVRRIVVHLGMESRDCRLCLLPFALQSDDPLIRLTACRELVHENENSLIELLNPLLDDGFIPVRREALHMLAQRFPPKAKEAWQRALFDHSYSIRDLARFQLANFGEKDFAQFYRKVLLANPEALTPLEGLSETADAADLSTFRKYSQHNTPSRRCAALRGLVRLSGENAVPELLELLRDENPSVIKQANKLLRNYLQSIDGDKLLAIALDAPQPPARKIAVRMLAEFSKWQSLPWLVRAAGFCDEETAAFALQWIGHLLNDNRVFTKPTDSEAKALRDALTDTKDRISQRLAENIAQEVRRFG